MPLDAYQDPSLMPARRAEDLVRRLTLKEKVGYMVHEATGIPRLGIPSYNWINECLHGVARAGVATVFPQAIGLAASWNTDLLGRVTEAISDEARAKHHEALRHNDRGMYKGLTYFDPNINIYRDPRWGRGHETFGEDPWLTARLGVSYVRGLQGPDPNHLKLVATPKHFAVHSGPESTRQAFNSKVSARDLWETYLPAFEACVVEGAAASVMGAYNRLNGTPCCSSYELLTTILRKRWGFTGYVVSDWGAIDWMYNNHHSAVSLEDAAAQSVKAGCDLNCGETYLHLLGAVNQGLVTEADIDLCVTRLFEACYKLDLFESAQPSPYASIPFEVVDCDKHREMAREAARQSLVLLKNKNKLLPLSDSIRSLAVIGSNADSLEPLLANYFGVPSSSVTPLQGLRKRLAPGAKIYYTPGCQLTGKSREGFSEALACASRAEVSVMVLGHSPRMEGEQGDTAGSDGGGDRLNLNLPGPQQELLEAVAALGKPIVLVLLNGGPLDLRWAEENIPAIMEAWYPGEEGGTAIAEALFGDFSPAGRLPISFVRDEKDLPHFHDYSMRGRGYRFMAGDALFPFGFGLSYTQFEYSQPSLTMIESKSGTEILVHAELANLGDRESDEVAQLYIRRLNAPNDAPKHWLAGFQRHRLAPGQKIRVEFKIAPRQLALVDDDGKTILSPGRYDLFLGSTQPDARSQELIGRAPLKLSLEWLQ